MDGYDVDVRQCVADTVELLAARKVTREHQPLHPRSAVCAPDSAQVLDQNLVNGVRRVGRQVYPGEPVEVDERVPLTAVVEDVADLEQQRRLAAADWS